MAVFGDTMTQTLTLTLPDDWHIHLREGKALATTVPHAAAVFGRVLCMPNLKTPIITATQAQDYHEQITKTLDACDLPASTKARFCPKMSLYLTDNTTVQDIKDAAQSDIIAAVKLYPSGATTNSASGVTNIKDCYAIFDAMQEHGLPLLTHGEVTDSDIDIFDREKVFLEQIFADIAEQFPALKLVAEHITTKEMADFVSESREGVCATITPQHLLFHRNHLLVGGVKPHFYCLPILKRQEHQARLLQVATSGSPKFFMGTDSAPHATHTKEAACGCAGCYTAPHALPLYAAAFDSVNALDKLQNFCSVFGAKFYGVSVNSEQVTLIKDEQHLPENYPYMDSDTLTPLLAGQPLAWRYQS